MLTCDAIGTYRARGLQEPFNLNKVDDHGNSLLMVAAQNGNLKMAKLFVYKGANPNHQVHRPRSRACELSLQCVGRVGLHAGEGRERLTRNRLTSANCK